MVEGLQKVVGGHRTMSLVCALVVVVATAAAGSAPLAVGEDCDTRCRVRLTAVPELSSRQ